MRKIAAGLRREWGALVDRDYLATGRARVGTVGDAASELLDAGDLVAFTVDWQAAA